MNKILHGKACPYEPGHEIEIKNYVINLNSVIMPPGWTGRWRITVFGSLISQSGYYECYQFFGDLYDV